MSESATIDAETVDWLTLDEDEEIVWSGKPHKSSLIPALVIGIPLSIILIGLFIIAGTYLQRSSRRVAAGGHPYSCRPAPCLECGTLRQSAAVPHSQNAGCVSVGS